MEGRIVFIIEAKASYRRGRMINQQVMNTRNSRLLLSVFDVSYSVTYSGDFFSLVIGDGDAEFFLELHDEFYGVEAISTEVGGECSVFSNLVLIYAELVDDDSFYAICDF